MESTYNSFISSVEINEAITLFKENDKMPSATRLSKFFLGTKPFKRVNLSSHALYKKYQNQFDERELTEYINNYLSTNNISKKDRPWDSIIFFDEEAFNKHTYQTVEAIKDSISKIELLKTTDLPDNIIKARKVHARAYENWSEEESELLLNALTKTNDLILLSKWFQRGQRAIKDQGKKLMYKQND